MKIKFRTCSIGRQSLREALMGAVGWEIVENHGSLQDRQNVLGNGFDPPHFLSVWGQFYVL